MTPLTKGLLTVGGLFIAFEAFRYFAVKEMNISIASISASQDKLVTNLTLNVRVENPSSWSNTIDSLQGNIYAGPSWVGTDYIEGPYTIPAQSKDGQGNVINGVITIPVMVGILDLALAAVVLKIFTGQMTEAKITFIGNVKANSIPIPIPINVSYVVV